MAVGGSGVNAMQMWIENDRLHETKSSCAGSLAVEDVDAAVDRLMAGEKLYVLLYGMTVPNVRTAVNERLRTVNGGMRMLPGLEPLKKMPRNLLVDWQIKELALAGMIDDFSMQQVKAIGQRKVISYGLSSAGYDMRISDEFRIFSAATGKLTCIDPKSFDESALVNFSGGECIIPPNSFALGRSVEYFRIPRNVMALCLGKSTYARLGIVCNFTPFEPEWEGHVTIEISNTTPLPCKVYANEGIAQCLFFETEQPTISYADRRGKYQKQTGVTLARV